MHNHPRNSSVSFDDLVEFIGSESIKTISVVKNNGGVEVLIKKNSYDKLDLLTNLDRLRRKNVKSKNKKQSDAEFRKVVRKFISKYEEEEILKWIK